MARLDSRVYCGKKGTGTRRSFPLVGEASIPRSQCGNIKKEAGNE